MQPMEQISDEKTDPIYFLLNLHAPEGHHEKGFKGSRTQGGWEGVEVESLERLGCTRRRP